MKAKDIIPGRFYYVRKVGVVLVIAQSTPSSWKVLTRNQRTEFVASREIISNATAAQFDTRLGRPKGEPTKPGRILVKYGEMILYDLNVWQWLLRERYNGIGLHANNDVIDIAGVTIEIDGTLIPRPPMENEES